GLGKARAARGYELIGNGEPEHAPRQLMIRVDGEHVAADAFGLRRLVELAILVGLLQRSVDAAGEDPLQHEVHRTVPPQVGCRFTVPGSRSLAPDSDLRRRIQEPWTVNREPSTIRSSSEFPPDPPQWIVELVDDAFLQRNDGVVGDVNVLGTDFGTALGDVAVADASLLLQISAARRHIERVHLEAGDADKEARSGEAILLIVIAQHVAHVLAQEALDAFAKLLHPVDVFLLHAPGAVRRVGRPRLEGGDAFVYLIVPGDIADQVFDHRESLQRRDGDGLTCGEL